LGPRRVADAAAAALRGNYRLKRVVVVITSVEEGVEPCRQGPPGPVNGVVLGQLGD
jgi:hypothetical protein